MVKAKKHLGQHFLKDDSISKRIAESLLLQTGYNQVLEIGPGTGALTKHLIARGDLDLRVIEVDTESIDYLHEHYPELDDRIINGNFLKANFDDWFEGKFGIIGNFPYNISTQILFKALENKDRIPEVVGMFQKEVAERIASGPGSKIYGITSVLLQAWYDIEYLFTVEPDVFIPPPKVKSAVIRLTRNNVTSLDCDEKRFVQIVKAAFNQRRKTMRNSLKSYVNAAANPPSAEILGKRPEQLSVAEFVALTNALAIQ